MAETSSSGNVVVSGGMAGALMTIFVWGCKHFFGLELPPEVVASMTTLAIGVGGWITKR